MQWFILPVVNFNGEGRNNTDKKVFRKRRFGDGISSEDLPFIFDRFWRSDPARQSGSGLGLAIARQLVNAHGGVISVESQPDQGTTFRINLPAAPA